MVDAKIEEANHHIKKLSERFLSSPCHSVGFGVHENLATFDKLKCYFVFIKETAKTESFSFEAGSDYKAFFFTLLQNRLRYEEKWEINASNTIIKFWFNLAEKFNLDIGDFKMLQYSF